MTPKGKMGTEAGTSGAHPPRRRGPAPKGYVYQPRPGGGDWWYQVRIFSKTYRRNTREDDRLVAEEMLAVFVEVMLLRDPRSPLPPRLTWVKLVEAWARLQRFDHARSYIRFVERVNRRWLKPLHALHLDEVRQEHVDAVIQAYWDRHDVLPVALLRVMGMLLQWAEEHRFRAPMDIDLSCHREDLREDQRRRARARREAREAEREAMLRPRPAVPIGPESTEAGVTPQIPSVAEEEQAEEPQARRGGMSFDWDCY